MSELSRNEIKGIDPDGMLHRILEFPTQLQQAREISQNVEFKLSTENVSNVCVTGMGGSAIGGDILRCYAMSHVSVPVMVSRYYTLPASVHAKSLVIASSYSGNTEETLSAYDEVCQRDANVACITSGGKLADEARSKGQPLFLVPSGFPPRSALGFMTVPLFYSLHYAGLLNSPDEEIAETIELLSDLSQEYDPDNGENMAKTIARRLVGKIPLIYASTPGFEAVALRWKGQLSENSKVHAFANVFPELNHNEIMGWGPLKNVNEQFQVIFLQDRADHPQVKKRMQITKGIVERHTSEVIDIESKGKSSLSRIFSLIFLGDMISLYLSALNKVDPTPVKNIEYLKGKL